MTVDKLEDEFYDLFDDATHTGIEHDVTNKYELWKLLMPKLTEYAKQEAEQAFNAGMRRGKDDVKEYFISDYEGQSPDKETYLLKYK